jgi:hypothetical protein
MHKRQASVHPGPHFRTCFLLAAAPLACIDSVRRAPTAGGRRGQEARGLAWRGQWARAGTHAPGPAAKHAPPGATLLYTRENQHSRLTAAPNIRHEEGQRPCGRRGAQAAQRHSRDEGCRAVGEHVHAPVREFVRMASIRKKTQPQPNARPQETKDCQGTVRTMTGANSIRKRGGLAIKAGIDYVSE